LSVKRLRPRSKNHPENFRKIVARLLPTLFEPKVTYSVGVPRQDDVRVAPTYAVMASSALLMVEPEIFQ